MHTQTGTGVLFVCMGNICRSPTAEGVFRKLHAQYMPQLPLRIDSAGTHAYHVGEQPDPRAQSAARRRGIDIIGHRGRVVTADDFTDFQYILAMDERNLRWLQGLRPRHNHAELRLLMEFAAGVSRREVPDPYNDGPPGFETVLNLVEQASRGLLAHIARGQGIRLDIAENGYRQKPARQ